MPLRRQVAEASLKDLNEIGIIEEVVVHPIPRKRDSVSSPLLFVRKECGGIIVIFEPDRLMAAL